MAVRKVVKRKVVKKKAPAPAPVVEVEEKVAAAASDLESEEPAAAPGGSWLSGLLDDEVKVQGLQEADKAGREESPSEEAFDGETLEVNGLEDDEDVPLSRKRVWDDDDDDDNDAPPTKRMAKMAPRSAPAWAAVGDEGADAAGDDDAASDISEEAAYTGGAGAAASDIFTNTATLVDRKRQLPAGTLDFQVLKDANAAEYSEGALSAVHFHPNGSLLLTAAPDFRLRLFQIDGTSSTKIQTVRFKDLPLRNARFTPSGTKVVCSAARSHYGVVDVESSTVNIVKGPAVERNLQHFACSPHANHVTFATSTGAAHIVSLATHQTLFSVKGDGPAQAVAYHPTREHELWTLGGAKVYVWDVRTRRPLRIHADEGATETTSLSVSETRYAIGSTNGVVNVYDLPGAFPANPIAPAPAPAKALFSLTTEATFSQFNNTGELLLVGSMKKKNALRMVHTSTLTTFSNFPRVGHHYRKPTCCDFSPESGMLCVGNDRGRALLFRLNYYGSA